MRLFFMLSFLLATVVSFCYSIMGFCGKDVILDPTYTKASDEEKACMDKKAYRTQGTIIFLFLSSITLSNLLRLFLKKAYFTYIGLGLLIVGIIYAIISHYTLKRRR